MYYQIPPVIPCLGMNTSEYLFPLHQNQHKCNPHQLKADKLSWTSAEPHRSLYQISFCIFISTEVFTKLIHFVLKQRTRRPLIAWLFLSCANRKMIKVSLYLTPAGDLGHDKDCGKTKNSPPRRAQNDHKASSYTTCIAQEHLYLFGAKVHLAQHCVSNTTWSVWQSIRRWYKNSILFL